MQPAAHCFLSSFKTGKKKSEFEIFDESPLMLSGPSRCASSVKSVNAEVLTSLPTGGKNACDDC